MTALRGAISVSSKIGIVVIGRNEGERLMRCLHACQPESYPVVYVDSGSTDGSCESARALAVQVVELDLSVPFTAARARNAGWQALISNHPDLEFVHFIDGDCEFVSGWLETARQFLESNPGYAVVCGRRRERFPERSVYNRLCDIEWDTPVGDAAACGGDALFRVACLKEAGGYTAALIAGEEPELCLRLRQKGWKIYRYGADMTLHDAAMFTVSQWWKRMKRGGYAYAEGYAQHGGRRAALENYRWPDIRRIVFWGAALPLLVLALVCIHPGFIALLGIYPLQVVRLAVRYSYSLQGWNTAFAYALANVVGKFAQMDGVIEYLLNRMRGRAGTLIEYK